MQNYEFLNIDDFFPARIRISEEKYLDPDPYSAGCLDPETQYYNQRYKDITNDPLIFSVAQGIFWLSSERLSRNTLHLIEAGTGESVLL
jgi:hypothetical protein